jgi:hypothetical protein
VCSQFRWTGVGGDALAANATLGAGSMGNFAMALLGEERDDHLVHRVAGATAELSASFTLVDGGAGVNTTGSSASPLGGIGGTLPRPGVDLNHNETLVKDAD